MRRDKLDAAQSLSDFEFRYAKSALQRWIDIDWRAAQLFESAPILTWLLIGRQQILNWPDEHVALILGEPRTKILSAICGLGYRSALNWLQKVELVSGDYDELSLLINGLRAELHRSPWAQNSSISLDWIAAAVAHPHLQQTPAFANYCQTSDDEQFHQHLLDHSRFWLDALRVAERLGITDAEIALNRARDFAAVRRLHDRWTDRLNQRQSQIANGQTRFPEPPIQGTDKIYPITSLEDLQAEGRLMHHCITVYENKILARQCYIYRVLAPERATLELHLKGNQLSLGQISLAYNAKASKETEAAVTEWLAQAEAKSNSQLNAR